MKFCKLDIKKATVNTVLQQAIYEAIVSKTTGRYKYEIIDDNYTIKITGKRSTNPKSPYKIADELVSRINSYKPDILRVVKTREDDQSPILLEVYVNPDYINQKFDSLPEEQKNHVNVDLSRDINFFNGDNSLMEQERKWDSDDELQFQKFTSQHTEGQVVSGTKGLFDPDELPFQKIPNYLSKEQSDAIDNVFNENPELANAVYSALGYSQESDFKQTFKNSLWRGQAAKPKIDNEGNLILNPSYEQLSKDYGKSFTTQRFMAESYGGRYSNNPYLIEIDEDYISNIYNLQDEDVEGEKRIIGKEQIKIPKEKFNIIAPSFKKYENENVDDLIKSYIYNDGLANSMDEIVFGGEVSAIEGLDYTPTKVLLEVILKKLKTDFDGLLHYIAKKNIESIPENIDEYDGNIYDVYYFQDNSASDLVYSAMQKYNKNYVPNIVKYSENNQITPQQKQQATFIFSKFLNVYLQNFEQVEKILKEEKIIDKKCS